MPITVSKRSGLIVKGHGRLEAAFKVGILKAPVDLQDYESEAAEHADMVADNRLAELAKIDRKSLQTLMSELKLTDLDMELTGFSQAELDKHFLDERQGLTEDDDAPAVGTKAKTKPGDLYILGDHRLLCGDATKKEDVCLLMGNKKADIAFADPPYNIGFSYNKHQDKMKYNDYKEFCERFFNLLPSESIIITPGPKNVGLWYDILKIRDIGWFRGGEIKDLISNEPVYDEGLWLKRNSRSGASCFNIRQCEPILFYGKFKRKRNFDIFDYTKVYEKGLIDAQKSSDLKNYAPGKPVAFMVDIIKSFSDKSDLISDFFLGNGTTLIACEKVFRRCYGIEKDPLYVDVMVKRWELWTGQKGVLQNG